MSITTLDTDPDIGDNTNSDVGRVTSTAGLGRPGHLEGPSDITTNEDVVRQADRERIARDLHDHVLQRLFAAGLTTQRVARGLASGKAADSLEEVVTLLDEAIREIRATVFELDGPLDPERGSVSTRLATVVSGLAPLLAFTPTLRFVGPVDALPEVLAADLVAVLREGLVNVKRHADARAADVTLTVLTDEVLVHLSDDGRGMDGSRRWSGLANLRTRARRHGGELLVRPASADLSGTCLQWSARLS